MICLIEDGYCPVGGAESNLCDACLRQNAYDRLNRAGYDIYDER